jgi:hypothetical protein
MALPGNGPTFRSGREHRTIPEGQEISCVTRRPSTPRADRRLHISSASLHDDVETGYGPPGLEPHVAFHGFHNDEISGRGLEVVK